MQLTEQQVLALAPDAQVASAGKKLGSAAPWSSIGSSERAIWGECKGSGSKPYQVRIDQSDHAAKCSCPSHKFPCKHAIGLLVLLSNQPALAAAASEPEWVADWLDKRAASAQNKQERAKAAAEVDPEAQQKRQEKRAGRIDDGLAALDVWMQDVMRRGLAQIASESPAFWEQQAARLVDAQAPGMANRLRNIGEMVGSTDDWPQRVLDGLGQLNLLLHAWQRKDALEPALRRELELQIGIVVREEEVLAQGEAVHDEWQVIAQTIDDQGRLRIRRSWLQGRQSGRYALLLHTAVNNQPFGENNIPGAAFLATLRFWPGIYPLRALVEGHIQSSTTPSAFWHRETHSAFLQRHAEALGGNPWLQRMPVVLHEVTPLQVNGRWWAVNRDGQGLVAQAPAPARLWNWVAHCGGQAVDVAGEWHEGRFTPVALYHADKYTVLEG